MLRLKKYTIKINFTFTSLDVATRTFKIMHLANIIFLWAELM